MAVIVRVIPIAIALILIAIGLIYLYRELFENLLPSRATIKNLLQDYGIQWTREKSISGHQRHFKTDGDSFLLLWEGTSDKLQQEAETISTFDSQFYETYVQGANGLFLIDKRLDEIKVSFYGQHIGKYTTVQALQAAMYKDWIRIPFKDANYRPNESLEYKPVLSQAKLEDKIRELLAEVGEKWVAENQTPVPETNGMKRHFDVQSTSSTLSLRVWVGTAEGILYKPTEEKEAYAVLSVVLDAHQPQYDVIIREAGFFYRAGENLQLYSEIKRAIHDAWTHLEFQNFE